MQLSIERLRKGLSEKVVFKKDDAINLHFKLPDGEVVSFEDVPFDLLMKNIQAYRKERINGHDVSLFIETDEDNDFDELQELGS